MSHPQELPFSLGRQLENKINRERLDWVEGSAKKKTKAGNRDCWGLGFLECPVTEGVTFE